MKSLREEISRRILVLDGAMGTMVQGYNLTENDFRGQLPLYREPHGHITTYKGNNDMLNLTRPDVIADIHERYLKAGADLIETNTFSAQRVSQADYHLEKFCYKINLEGAKIARCKADEYSTEAKPRFVLGSIGPTNKTLSMSPDVSDPSLRALTYDELFDAYREQARGLLDGGVDAFLIETIFDTLNAKTAIDAVCTEMKISGIDVPIMLSVTISDLAGRTLSGQTIEAFLASIETYDILSVGLNCSFGARQMKPYIEDLARRAPYYISAYPNAGLPNSMGLYDETAESMAPQMEEYLKEGLLNIIGGCCGTNDEFIRRYAEMAPHYAPHMPAPKPTTMVLSGLEAFYVRKGTFNNVGERCNVAGSRKFLRLIKEKNYDEAMTIARKQVNDGALILDINMDDGLLDAKAEMTHFLNMIGSDPDIARVPVMIDSSDWNVIVAALKCCQGKSIVNSISLKGGEEQFLAHASDVKRYGAAVVVMCFDEQGQATTYGRRIEIAARAYRLLVEKAGLNPLNVIIDPNILSIATGMEEHDSYAVDFIRATEWIRKNLPGAHVSGGVSNLSFSFRGNNYIREAMHAVFLYHAINAGMDFGIINPSSKITYSDIPKDQLQIIEDVVLNRRKDASERLTELADKVMREKEAGKLSASAAASAPKEEQWRSLPLDERLKYALRKGVGDYLDSDLKEALAAYPKAVNIIEGPLMDGMNEVGQLFGEGKMFLPQVVKTARTMKQAVSVLQPYIEADNARSGVKAGKMILATVKGDVHDIGKNIVGVVMSCNNYEVIDMGVMVPADQIVKKAIEEHADMIGLSGLITPSLEEMVSVAHEVEKAGLNIPILIGGATTSELHVALKIAPVYGGPVVWVKDAAQDVIVASHLMNKEESKKYVDGLNDKYEHMRREYRQEQETLLGIDEARRNKLNLFDE